MHGLMFFELKKFTEEKFPPQFWDKVLKHCHFEAKNYSVLQTYSDSDMDALLRAIAELSNQPLSDIHYQYGLYLAPHFLNSSRLHIDPQWNIIDLFEHTSRIFHSSVMKAAQGSLPPELKTKRISPNEVIIFYNSPRKMCALAKGIIEGVAKTTESEITLTETECTQKGDPHCKLIVKLIKSSSKDLLVKQPFNIATEASP